MRSQVFGLRVSLVLGIVTSSPVLPRKRTWDFSWRNTVKWLRSNAAISSSPEIRGPSRWGSPSRRDRTSKSLLCL